MDQWAEQTLLKLLELIASLHRPATAADVDGAAAATDASSVLHELALGDPSFAEWLSRHAPADHGSEMDDRWLEGLATDCGSASSETSLGSRSNGQPSSTATAQQTLRGSCLRAIISSARAVVALRAQTRNASRMHEQLAQLLAYDMAYGLSHELNNPLANIASRARLLAEEEADPRKQQLLAAIVDQAMRGCEMIADLMLFARPRQPVNDSIDLAQLLKELAAQANAWSSARGLMLNLKIARADFVIQADRAMAKEAVWAALRNAIEVAKSEVVITLSTDENGLSLHQGIGSDASPSQIMMLISDDGPGISDQAQSHAFHPYFSGREAGRGLGLGMSKVARFMHLSGGYATIENARRGGCTVRLVWPGKSS